MNQSLRNYLEKSGLLAATVTDRFASGIAAAFAVEAWKHDNEDFVKGGEVLAQAAPTTTRALLAAWYYCGVLTSANKINLSSLLCRAFYPDFPNNKNQADGKWLEGDWSYEFGWYIAMQALGHGVSWSDDHEWHPTVIPHHEVTEGGLYLDRPPIVEITDNMFGYLRECFYEEAGETLQRLGKIGRFHETEMEPKHPHDNGYRFMQEFADMHGVFEAIVESGRVPALDPALVKDKQRRMKKWFVHSINQGRISWQDVMPFLTPDEITQFLGELIKSGHTKIAPVHA